MKISKLLRPSVRLVEHTILTQNEVGKQDTVLWDKRPCSIDINTYMEFKDAIKKRSSKYYMFNHILSYPDFCIGLLCSLEYSLNHKVTVSIPDRTFTAAWRTIEVIGATGTDKVSSWIRSFIASRSSTGYCNSLGIVLDNQITPILLVEDNNEIQKIGDSQLVSSIVASDKIVELIRDNNIDNNSTINIGKVFQTTLTPEGQLYDLVIAHSMFNNTLF